jgi:hypothetical protein
MLTLLEEEIAHFDAVLDRIQKLMPQDLKVYDRVVEARDVMFRLQQQMRGCEIVEFCAPWIDSDDISYLYEQPADLFWNRREEDPEPYYLHNTEEDPTRS